MSDQGRRATRTAEDLDDLGTRARHRGQWAAARRAYALALTRDPDTDTRARILIGLAWVESENGSMTRAVDLLARAHPQQPVTRGRLYATRAQLHVMDGAYDAALTDFGAAEPLLRPDVEMSAALHLNRGGIHLQRHDAARAAADFDACVALADRAGLDLLAAKARHNLGYARMRRGDVVDGLLDMDRARQLLAAVSPSYGALADLDRAEALLAAGMTASARGLLAQSAAVLGRARMRQAQGEAEIQLGRLLLLAEEPAAARRVLRAAERRFTARGSRAWAARAEQLALSSRVLATPAPGRAALGRLLDDLGTNTALLRRLGLQTEAVAGRLLVARAATLLGEPAVATRALRGVRIDDRAPLPTRLLAHETRARVAAGRGRRTASLAHARAGVREVLAWQATLGGLDFRSSAAGHARPLVLFALSEVLREPVSRRATATLEWTERARQLATSVRPVRRSTHRDAALLDTLRHRDTLDPATARTLMDRVREQAWREDVEGAVGEPVALADLRAALAARAAALVSYFVADDRVHALVVVPADDDSLGATGATVRTLAPLTEVLAAGHGLHHDLGLHAGGLPDGLAAAIAASIRGRLARLAGVLVTPVAADLTPHRVVLASAARLSEIPWALLPGLDDRPLSVVRSATEWAGGGPPGVIDRVGAVAGPRVERADAETQTVCSVWPGAGASALTGRRADVARVSRLASSVDLLHIAAHGRHARDHPLFSGFELADGTWFGCDIDQLRAVPRMVVLSSCELGGATDRWGLDALGMTAAWLHAGTRAVIASPVLLSDADAARSMQVVHTELVSGARPADALATARAALAPRLLPLTCYGNGC